MEDIITALLRSGYQVTLFPGKRAENSLEMATGDGYTAVIYTMAYLTHNRGEKWEAYADTPDRALKLAAIALREHIRPAYDGYMLLANRLGWEK